MAAIYRLSAAPIYPAVPDFERATRPAAGAGPLARAPAAAR
jgi:hypothetical protein